MIPKQEAGLSRAQCDPQTKEINNKNHQQQQKTRSHNILLLYTFISRKQANTLFPLLHIVSETEMEGKSIPDQSTCSCQVYNYYMWKV